MCLVSKSPLLAKSSTLRCDPEKTNFFLAASEHKEIHLHCEKSFFVLASRQKIPVLRTENPAVDTRTICLLPIEFFLNYPCQKSYGGKIPARNNRYGRKIPAFWCQKR
jgi:hypothetical protein